MSREIRFRGKRIDNDEWVYGDLAHDWNKDTHIIKFDCFGPDITACGDCGCNEANSFEVDSETVGQYAERKDKNGKEIYEGTILDESYINPMSNQKILRLYEVVFANGGFYAKLIGHSPFGDKPLYFIQNGEVIGNVFDNSELLENPSCS